MAILDLSPKYGHEGGERVLQDRSTIVAYLEDLLRSRAEVALVVSGLAPLPARVVQVEEDPPRFRLRLGRPLVVARARRQEFGLLFTLDGIRLLAPVRFLERGGYLEAWFSLPATVAHADRRSRMRVHFGAREKATVTVLEGFLGARGATGPLLNLSLEGLLMRVERAITVHGKAPIAVGAATFAPGTRFPVLRLDQLPYSPVVVCAGVLSRISHAADGVQMGIRFEDLGEMEAQVIRQVLGRRLPKFNLGFPERRRRKGAPAEGEATVTVVHQGPSRPETHATYGPGDPRKADRRILLAVPDNLDRTILASSLRVDGFRKIHEARSFTEAIDQLQVFAMDVVILGEQVGPLAAGEFLARLRRQGHCQATPAVLLAEELDDATRSRAASAHIQHVLALGRDYEEAFKDVLETLLGL